MYVFFFKQKTAYEMRISDWSSDVCSSDLAIDDAAAIAIERHPADPPARVARRAVVEHHRRIGVVHQHRPGRQVPIVPRSEEHTSELQSLMRISYAVFCLQKKTHAIEEHYVTEHTLYNN